ncbi:MAG: MBL fold metallo-hydrolase [Methylotenera sp.]|nr:MBL fold metallo-hydrolase [Oligoflexia bacterium]
MLSSPQSNQAIDQTVVVGSFQCNCRILVCPKTGHTVLIDPGDEPGKIIQRLTQLKTDSGLPLQVKYLFHTHAHLDHIGGTREVCEHVRAQELLAEIPPTSPLGTARPALIALHQEDEFIYQMLKKQGEMFGIAYDEPLPIDHYFSDGETLEVGAMKFSVLHTPGHSPGGVCIRLHEDSALGIRESLFSGDTLFKGSVGRTDLWGADQGLMFKNIKDRIFTLDEDTRVCPGHGPETSVGLEKRKNPFFN